jgi:hypothetical protein
MLRPKAADARDVALAPPGREQPEMIARGSDVSLVPKAPARLAPGGFLFIYFAFRH